jgi:NitT/TauT family transport system substrate-binding protein
MIARLVHNRQAAQCAFCAVALFSLIQPALAQTNLKFSLDWKYEGTQAPFLAALDRGYFRNEGLRVTIDTGSSSYDSISRLASGTYDMAFGDVNLLVKFRDQNPTSPVKAVFMTYNIPPYSVVTRKSRGVRTPKDLEGKKLGAPTADAAFAQWPLFAELTNIDQSKVTVMNIGFAVREPMLVLGHVDAITGLSFSSYINVAYGGIPRDDIIVFKMGDYGVSLYGHAIMAGPKFAAEKPEAVKGFLRAYLKGLKDTVKDPSSTVNSVLTRNPVAAKPLELERLHMALQDNILTPEVRTKGFGAVDHARLDKAIEQIGLTYSFGSAKPKAQDIFDPSFLPAESERKVD